MNNKGSVAILLVIIMALISALGASLLNVVYGNYQIKMFNKERKRSFYLSEKGLFESYVVIKGLINEAINNSLEKAEEYLEEYPLNEEAAQDIFILNYKQYIISNIQRKLATRANPSVEIRNEENLVFVDEVLCVLLRSTYTSENNVVEITWVDIIITVPEFNHIRNGMYSGGDYVAIGKWRS